MRIAPGMWVASALLLGGLLHGPPVHSQEGAAPGAAVLLSFHHVVFDMTDSLAEVTEMLIFQRTDSMPGHPGPDSGGIEIPLADGFLNLRLGGQPDDWRVNDSHDRLMYTAPLTAGMNRLVLSYNLAPEAGTAQFVQQVRYPTRKYVFVTSNPGIELESAVLTDEESVPSGETEVRGVSGENLAPGTEVVVVAKLFTPSRARYSPRFAFALGSLLVLSVAVYATARRARKACTGDARLVELEERRESLEKRIAGLEGERRRACEERLAATDRLINLIVDIRKRGTVSP